MVDDRSERPPVDEAIDRTVRQMMSADPRTGFEHRVMRRLERPARQPFAWPGLATAAAALVAFVVLAMTLLNRPEQSRAPVVPTAPQSGSIVSSEPASGQQSEVSPVPTGLPERPSTVKTPQTRRTRPERMVAAATVANVVEEPSPIHTIAALNAPSALAVENIEQQPVRLREIRMASIEIGQLNVQPLRPLDGSGKE